MFNNSNQGRPRDGATPGSAATGKPGMFSVIGQDVVITGNITATADLHIDGRIDGDVDCGALVQGPDSHVIGNVRAETARLTGTIEGRVMARQLVVERTARVTGDVEYETISIENGATIDGHLRHKSPGTLNRADGPAKIDLSSEPLLLQGGMAA